MVVIVVIGVVVGAWSGWWPLGVLTSLVAYGGACWWWPMVRCGRCHGSGKLRSPSGRAWRPCWWCGGHGSRVRLGRQMMGWLNSGD